MAKFLNKRQSRQLAIAVSMGGLLMSFQNCAPPTQNDLCPKGQVCNSDSEAGKIPSGTGSGGSSGSGSSSGGFGPSGGGSSGGSGSNSGGFGGSTGGSTTTPPTGGSTNNNLRFEKNLPPFVSVNEGSGFSFDVVVNGGKTPYTYTWYLNTAKLDTSIYAASPNYYGTTADRYSKEGNYEVEVVDANGTKIRSSILTVSFIEPQRGCVAGAYAMMSGADRLTQLKREELFENRRGKFLISMTNQELLGTDSNPGYWGLSLYSYNAANYKEQRLVACTTKIPRGVNDPTPYLQNYQDYKYVSSGNIRVECHNNKWLVVENTCKWTKQCLYGSYGNGTCLSQNLGGGHN